METIKESLKESNKHLALRNLDKEPILIDEKQKLAGLHDELGKMREEYKNIRGQYGKSIYMKIFFENQIFEFLDDQTGETSPEVIYILLQTTASELERATEVH
jgi:hypothetical protein